MKHSVAIVLVVTALAGLSGCRTLWRAPRETSSYEEVPSLIPYQLKAMEYEKNDQLQDALANWRIAEALMTERINALTEHLENNAERHYQKGISFLNAGNMDQARLEFLKTLRYEPVHSGALTHLKTSFGPTRTQEYTVEEGDTFSSIAGRVYQNKDRDFLVSFFSGVDKEKELVPGRKLALPVLELEFTKRFFSYHKEMAQARSDFKKKKYQRVLPIAENILKHRPGNEEAEFMINSSYSGLADQLLDAKKYDEAIDMLKKIDHKFRNVNKRIRKIEALKARLKAEDVESKNSAGYHAGLTLFKKGDYVKALEKFEAVDPGYADVQDKILELKKLMKQESETLYRKGVKFFLNEKLEEAISEWEKALALDPDNTKVRKDIDNATKLLKKINEIN